MVSVLAGEASATFSLALGHPGAFDCCLSTLPHPFLVVDYFRWRSEDAHRNSLNAYCYWKLRKKGESVAAATRLLSGASVADKNEILYGFGINYNHLPPWQKRGMGFYYESTQKTALNLLTGEDVSTTRKTLKANLDLPIDEEYSKFVASIINLEYPTP